MTRFIDWARRVDALDPREGAGDACVTADDWRSDQAYYAREAWSELEDDGAGDCDDWCGGGCPVSDDDAADSRALVVVEGGRVWDDVADADLIDNSSVARS
jgi:hypothetical protein